MYNPFQKAVYDRAVATGVAFTREGYLREYLLPQYNHMIMDFSMKLYQADRGILVKTILLPFANNGFSTKVIENLYYLLMDVDLTAYRHISPKVSIYNAHRLVNDKFIYDYTEVELECKGNKIEVLISLDETKDYSHYTNYVVKELFYQYKDEIVRKEITLPILDGETAISNEFIDNAYIPYICIEDAAKYTKIGGNEADLRARGIII